MSSITNYLRLWFLNHKKIVGLTETAAQCQQWQMTSAHSCSFRFLIHGRSFVFIYTTKPFLPFQISIWQHLKLSRRSYIQLRDSAIYLKGLRTYGMRSSFKIYFRVLNQFIRAYIHKICLQRSRIQSRIFNFWILFAPVTFFE